MKKTKMNHEDEEDHKDKEDDDEADDNKEKEGQDEEKEHKSLPCNVELNSSSVLEIFISVSFCFLRIRRWKCKLHLKAVFWTNIWENETRDEFLWLEFKIPGQRYYFW